MSSEEPIYFYEKGDKYYEFSNFYECKIEFDGITYPTSEHLYQSAKFYGETEEELEYIKIISKASTPNKARILASQEIGGGYKWKTDLNPIITKYRNLGVKMRDDWEDIKVDVMRAIVYIKFSENQKLKQLLLSTGDRDLFEHTHRDKFWADGGNGSGKNWLGRILMETRERISKNR